MLARRTQASALAIVSSKSLDKRRQRLSQANVRSIPQRFGSGLNVPVLSALVTISINHLPNSESAWSSCFPRYTRCNPLYSGDWLPMACFAEGLSAIHDGSALLLRLARPQC